MKLAEAQALYIQQIQARGCAGASIAEVLRMFARTIGGERELKTILTVEVRAFLGGTRPLTPQAFGIAGLLSLRLRTVHGGEHADGDVACAALTKASLVQQLENSFNLAHG